MVWQELRERHVYGAPAGEPAKGFFQSRIDRLRASVDFTSFRGQDSAETLQEYFVPPARLALMMNALKAFNVLSTTLRVVGRDADTVLSYCADGPRICIAVDAQAGAVVAGSAQVLSPAAQAVISASSDAALAHGGTWYLPYVSVADKSLFQSAYQRHAELRAAIARCNPVKAGMHRFWNSFLARYFT